MTAASAPRAIFTDTPSMMAYVGLVPSERSSGARTSRGRITLAGNAHARTMLVEAGWTYRLPAREERRYLERVANLPADIQAIGWKAQVRLCQRFRPVGRGQAPAQGEHRDRARAGRLRLGHRPARAGGGSGLSAST